jgi:hypothetical protein
MTVRRHSMWAVTTLLAATLLAACGGSDDDPAIKPVTGTPSATATSADPDGLTPEQREVADAVQAYVSAFFGRGTTPVGTAVGDLITAKLRDGLVPAETKAVDDAGLQYIGTPVLDPEDVTIKGDTATYTGCNDGSQVFTVKKGETTAGVGSRNVGITRITYKLVRQDGRWLVDEPRGEQVQSC